MSESKSVNYHFGGFASMLTVLFIALKLMGKIAWSWVWVLAPLWIGASITILCLALLAFIAICVAIWSR